MGVSINKHKIVGVKRGSFITAPLALPYSNLYSVEFDGSDDYLIKSGAVPAVGAGDFSVSFWVYRIADSGADEYIMYSDAASDWKIYIKGSNDRMQFESADFNDVASQTVATGAWEHWVITIDRGNKSIWYKNGSAIDQKTISGTTNYDDTPVAFTIGRDNGSTFNFNGRLDEISIWNAALSASNISDIYNSGDPSDLSEESFAGNLIHWWRMGDPGGTGTYPTIVDVQGGTMRMTMTNMTDTDINTNVP